MHGPPNGSVSVVPAEAASRTSSADPLPIQPPPGRGVELLFSRQALVQLLRTAVPGLTTVAQPIQALGEHAANILIEQIETPQQEVKKMVLECTLIVRGSTDQV